MIIESRIDGLERRRGEAGEKRGSAEEKRRGSVEDKGVRDGWLGGSILLCTRGHRVGLACLGPGPARAVRGRSRGQPSGDRTDEA